MKIQVLEPFSPAVGINYNVGDVVEVDDKTGDLLIKAKRAVLDGEYKPFENFNPFAPKDKPVMQQVAQAAVQAVSDGVESAKAAIRQQTQTQNKNKHKRR